MLKKTTGVKIRKIDCPYCAVRMKYRGSQRIQRGRWRFFLEHLELLFSGSLDVQLYECPKCGKIEMFRIRK